MTQFWAILYGSSLAFTMNASTETLSVDSNTWVIVQSTQGIRQAVNFVWDNGLSYGADYINGLPQPDDLFEDAFWGAYRMRAQGLEFQPDGTSRITLKASTPIEFILAWDRTSRQFPALSTMAPMGVDTHYVVSTSTKVLTDYAAVRHKLRPTERTRLYTGFKYVWTSVFNDWISPSLK